MCNSIVVGFLFFRSFVVVYFLTTLSLFLCFYFDRVFNYGAPESPPPSSRFSFRSCFSQLIMKICVLLGTTIGVTRRPPPVKETLNVGHIEGY